MSDNKTLTDEAFELYCRDPLVVQALSMTRGTLSTNLLRTAFLAGAQFAIARCKASGH